jgi:hypothetical protein
LRRGALDGRKLTVLACSRATGTPARPRSVIR